MVEVKTAKSLDVQVWAVLLAALALGFVLRISALQEIPGFEHDEALICLGARSISTGDALPLTGDKVYEGPLLEYFLAVPMLFRLHAPWILRLILAVTACLSIAFVFIIGRNMHSAKTGAIAAVLFAIHPWSLSISRVIYACNFGIVFLLAYIAVASSRLIQHFEIRASFWAAASGVLIGLAVMGRWTAGIWILLSFGVILLTRDRSVTKGLQAILPAIAGFLLTISPMIVYNAKNNWPLVTVFMSADQAHFVGSAQHPIQFYFQRIAAFLQSLFDILDGSGFWLDVHMKSPCYMQILAICVILGGVAGLVTVCVRGTPVARLVCLNLILAVMMIPMITKHRVSDSGGLYYHPHYFDLILPIIFIVSGLGIAACLDRIPFHRIRNVIFLVTAVILLTLPLLFSLVEIFPAFIKTGGPGRWNRRFETIASGIRTRMDIEVPPVYVNWQFAAGYPQLKYLLTNHDVRPYLGEFYGSYTPDGNLRNTDIILVSPSLEDSVLPYSWSRVTSGPECFPYTAWRFTSPGVYIDGTLTPKSAAAVALRIDSWKDPVHGWSGVGSAELPGSDRVSCRVTERMDFRAKLPQIQNLVHQVTPRHRDELRYLELFPVSFFVRCVVDREVPLEMRWTPGETSWMAEIRIEDTIYRGNFEGSVRFY